MNEYETMCAMMPNTDDEEQNTTWDELDAATVEELEEKSTEALINRYKANWMVHCNEEGGFDAEHMAAAVKEMSRIEDVIDSRGVLTKAELHAIRNVDD